MRIARWFADWDRERRSELAALHAEIRGELKFPSANAQLHAHGASPTASSGAATALRHPRLQDRAGAHRKAGAHGACAAIDAGSRHPACRRVQGRLPPGSVAEIAYVTLKGGEPAGKPSSRSISRTARPTARPSTRWRSSRTWRRDSRTRATPYLLAGASDVDDALRRLRPPGARQGMVAHRRRGGGRRRMSTPRAIPAAVRSAQVEAADPEVSAFVSANAGSGKTYVLAQRVINLLLRGVDPAKILCITFTKTAAANMANEVFERAGRLDRARRRRARRADRAIDRPQGRCARPRAGAAAVRLGAGDAGRPEGADHPRLLHAAAAPVPVRGQCRRALYRAGRGFDHADCSTN